MKEICVVCFHLHNEDAVATAEAKKAVCQAAEAQRTISLARVEVAKTMVERTLLIAPFSGIVAEVNGESENM